MYVPIIRTGGEKQVFAGKSSFFQAIFSYGFLKQLTLQIKMLLLNFQFPALLLLRSQPGERQHETRLLTKLKNDVTSSPYFNRESMERQLTFYEQWESISNGTRHEFMVRATYQK